MTSTDGDELSGSGRRSRKSQQPQVDGRQTILLNEKKRARRRLVGAVALTLSLVIVLPMILDSKPKSALDDIDIRIPSKDKLLPMSRSEPVVPGVRPVKKQAVAKPKVASLPIKAGEGVVIQVAALSNQKKVSELRARLKRAGIKTFTQKVTTQKGKTIRIRIGPFKSIKTAQSSCLKVAKMRLACKILPN